MKANDEQATNLALSDMLRAIDLSTVELESTVIALLQHIYPNDVAKILLFIQAMSKVKNV